MKINIIWFIDPRGTLSLCCEIAIEIDVIRFISFN